MIRNTHAHSPEGVLSAYKDNAAVIEGSQRASAISPIRRRAFIAARVEAVDILIKVETHNHPTAIAPFPGAATGSGGEIRDEGATGTGAKPKAGSVGFSVSNLRIPDFEQPWDPTPLQGGGAMGLQTSANPIASFRRSHIMIEGPIGAASFNNEFGRPNICGYFRTFEQQAAGDAPTASAATTNRS